MKWVIQICLLFLNKKQFREAITSFFPCILWGEITLTEKVFSYLKFADTLFCYAAANMVLDPQELQYFDTVMFVLLLISTMSQFLLLLALVSLSVPGSYTRGTSVSLSKTKFFVIKRCVTGYVHRQRHYSPTNSVCFLLWVQHDIYQEYLWREKVKFSVMVLVGVPWEGSFLGLCAAPPICGWGQPSKWYLTHDLERWEHFIDVLKSKDNDGPGKKQRQCLLLTPTDLCYASLSASVVIFLLGSGFTPCEKSWVLTARRQSTGKEIQSAMFRCVYLDWLTTQVSRKPSVSRSPDLLHGKHLRCLVCLCMLNGRWMDITSVPVHCVLAISSGFVLSSTHNISSRDFLHWLLLVSVICNAEQVSLNKKLLLWRASSLCPDRCLYFCLFQFWESQTLIW